jgi:hypothetical protein
MRISVVVIALVAIVLAGCSSSGSKASRSNDSAASTSTTALPPLPTTAPGDPDQTPNPIPFDVGEIAARSGGWLVGVTHVVRPLGDAALPSLPAGQEYVGVDIKMSYAGASPVTVSSRDVFGVNDVTGKGHAAISGAKGTTGLDGTYSSGTTKTGRMIFAVPTGKQLLMLMNGPAIKTQNTVFQVDPPTHPPVD